MEPVRGSRLLKAIVILFTEYFYRCGLRDHPQISPSQPHGCRSCFFPAFPEVRFFWGWEAFRPTGLVTRLGLSRERGMVAVLAYPYLLRGFPGYLVAFDTSIPLWEPYPASWRSQHSRVRLPRTTLLGSATKGGKKVPRSSRPTGMYP